MRPRHRQSRRSDALKVDKDAHITVVLYVNREVKANYAFKKGEMKDADVEKILKDLPKITEKAD
jgi:hypothetical protein